ncbi:MAG: hypothetical protein IH571_07140, partial [Acholeplasmataceae bacterium]|nr:hypothetical protein [Acholeplasmataceae bacterium]
GDNTHASGFNHSFAVGNVNPTVSANTGSSIFSGGLVGRTITLSGLLVNYRPLSGQTVGGTPNSIGLTTDISNFQSETWVPTTLQWSTDIWRFELSNYPKLIKNHN